MPEAKLQERLPLNYFRDFDDESAILLYGMEKYRRRYDRNNSWPMRAEFYVHTNPVEEVPKLAADVASLAPASSVLANPDMVQNIFNILAFNTPVQLELAKIPYVPVDNRGKV